MIEVVEVGYSTPKQIQDIIINDAANASETETYSIDKIKDLIENSNPEIPPLQVFVNNTDALAGGLSVNDFYRLPASGDVSLVAVVSPPPPPPLPNFKIIGNFWGAGIYSEEDFFLRFYALNSNAWQFQTFNISSSLIELNLTNSNNSPILDLTGFGITEVIRIPNNISLSQLILTNNSIVNFNPLTLPSIAILILLHNQMVYFDSPLTYNIGRFLFSFNQMTIQGYAMMENWAANLISTTDVYIGSNAESVVNTNLLTILQSKGVTVHF